MSTFMFYVLAILSALVLGMGWLIDHQRNELEGTRQSLIATKQAYDQESSRREASETSLAGLITDKARIVATNKELNRALKTLIPAGTPDLPGGFRVLHDAAAAGVLPEAPSGPPAAPVAAEDAASVVNDNYAACREQDAAYQRLQQWLQGVTR